jgi:hypothetical protein
MSRNIAEAHRLLLEAARALEAQMAKGAVPWVPLAEDSEQLGRLLDFVLEPDDYVYVNAQRTARR